MLQGFGQKVSQGGLWPKFEAKRFIYHQGGVNMKSKADKVLEEVAKACQNPLLVAIGAMCSSPQEAVNVAAGLDLNNEEIQLARWIAILKRDCQTFFGQDFLKVFKEICTKKERTPMVMRSKAEIWAKINYIVEFRNQNHQSRDHYSFFEKFQMEFRNKENYGLQAVLDRLEQETMQVFILDRDYYPCSCHPARPEDKLCKSGWHATAKTAYYDHNNLFRVLLIAELLGDEHKMTQFYQRYIQQQQTSETWITDNRRYLSRLYDFIADIDNRLLLSEIAKIVVEFHPQSVYFACKDGRISDPIFFTYVKKRLLEIQGINQAMFCAGNLGEDPELLAMIAEYEANSPPPKKIVVSDWGRDSVGIWRPIFKEV